MKQIRGRLSFGTTVLGLAAVAALAAGPLAAQVSISEIRIDQPSTDNDEYFELAASPGTDLTGMSYVVIGDGTGGSGVVEAVVDLSGQAVPGGGFFVAAEGTFTIGTADFTTSLDFENSDNVTHMLVDGFAGAVGNDLDTNDDGTLDSTPWSAVLDCVALIETVGSGDLTYCADSVGPDGSFVPAHVMDCPGGFQIGAFDPSGGDDTPGAANSCGQVVVSINEIRIDQPSSDNDEYFELAGDAGDPLDGLTYLVVGDGTGGSGVIEAVVDLTGSAVPAGGFFVAAESTFTIGTADLTTSLDFENSDNVTHLVVRDFTGANGSDLDTNDDGSFDTTPWSEIVDCVALIETVGSGDLTYCADSVGPDGSFVPAHVYECPSGFEIGAFDPSGGDDTPGAANACGGGPGGGALVINEIDYDQPSFDTAEFVEIRNNDAVDVSLSGVTLELVNGTGGGASIYQSVALPGVTLAPGEYYVVCSDAATVINCDLAVLNSIQNGGPDAVALTSAGSILDTVSYEGDTGAPYTEGSGAGLFDSGSSGNDNKSISRIPDGLDTDVNNVDFSFVCATPGAVNTTATSSCPSVAPPNLVINEIDYDQPGSDTAEFVEILNTGTGDQDLSGIDLVLVNGSGGGAVVYNTIPLPSVTLGAGEHFVICGNAANVANCDLDASPSSNLIQNGPDAVALVLGGTVLDTVSYEGNTGAPYTEGSGAGLFDSGSSGQDYRGIGRFPDGSDTDQNNVDLGNACITPGSANTSLTSGCSPLAPVVEIYDIQGSGSASALDGQTVRTEDNVVTAVGPDRFAIQTPTSRSDGSVDTSDGIIVFTGAAPTVAVGDTVTVTGVVDEFFNLTEFAGGSLVEIGGGAEPMPAAVVFDATVPSPDPTASSCAIEYECYEGMLIEIAAGTVTGPNQRFNPDPIAEVFITAAPARTFREPGIEYPGLAGFPVWDGNPEIFELDPDKMGLANQTIPAGSSFSATGVLGFEFGGYELWPTDFSVVEAVLPVPVDPRGDGEMTVGSLNLFRLFDDTDDGGEQVVSAAEYQRRLTKFAGYILGVLDAPDVLAVQEAEKLGVLEDLAAEIALVDPAVVYSAELAEGNDVGGIDVGFLVRDTVVVDAVTQLAAAELLTYDNSLLHDRPPLLLEGRCVAAGLPGQPVRVLNVHMRSLGGIDDATDGPRVRQKRLEQAESVATIVQGLQTADADTPLMVVGDFNGFEFTDGYVDLVGHVAGSFVPADNLVCDTNPCADLVNPDLTKQVLSVASEERYSFIFRGNAQVLDHALTSAGTDPVVRGFLYGRGNADAAVDLINDGGTELRSSDHDGFVLYLAKDSDQDGVTDDLDVCPGTILPEGVPTDGLGINRWALTDGDGIFDTVLPNGNGTGLGFSIEDTAGCSCEQIIEAQGLGQGHTKFGCSNEAMLDWVTFVNGG